MATKFAMNLPPMPGPPGAPPRPPGAPPAPQSIRVLSVQQPWADGLVLGWKPVENRTWKTPYRGRIYIHASKIGPRPEFAEIPWEEQSDFKRMAMALFDLPGTRRTGAIIGSVELVDIVPVEWIDEMAADSTVDGLPDSQVFARAAVKFSEQGATTDRLRRVWKAAKPYAKAGHDCHLSMFSGPECWIVERPMVLTNPIQIGGKLNLWTLPVQLLPDDDFPPAGSIPPIPRVDRKPK